MRVPRNKVHWAWNRSDKPCVLYESHAPGNIGAPRVRDTAGPLFRAGESLPTGRYPLVSWLSTEYAENVEKANRPSVEWRTDSALRRSAGQRAHNRFRGTVFVRGLFTVSNRASLSQRRIRAAASGLTSRFRAAHACNLRANCGFFSRRRPIIFTRVTSCAFRVSLRTGAGIPAQDRANYSRRTLRC